MLGCHIEMTQRPGVDYPFGVGWRPLEHELQLGLDDLLLLDKVLRLAGDVIKIYELRDFIVYPIN